MKRLSVLLIVALSMLSMGFADSLLKNNKSSSPTKQYKLNNIKKRPKYPFKLRDTVMVNVAIDDTIQFSKKHDIKKDITWLNAFKNYITHFGGTNPSALPRVEFEAKNQSKAKGSKQETSKIRLEIPCEIIEILPNGDLVLDGSRTIRADESNATIRLGGRLNPKYVSTVTDTVFSERILSLKVITDFQGPMRDSERRGWLSRIFDKIKIF
jgi:flagellar basal body L-ring protein FlgH